MPKDPLESLDPIKSTENFTDQINEIDCEIRKFDISSHGLEGEISFPISNANCDKDPIQSTSGLPRKNPLRVVSNTSPEPVRNKPHKWLRVDRPLGLKFNDEISPNLGKHYQNVIMGEPPHHKAYNSSSPWKF